MSSPASEIKPLSTTILRAGAGAGKTTTLIRLFEETAISFKKQHGRFPRMVLTTFTRKATQELRERLLSQALDKDKPELFRYINQRSKVHISTIHGVLSLYLMQFGKELGLAPEFSVVEGPEIKFRQKKILKKLLLENSDYLELVEVYEVQNLLDMLNLYYQHHFLHDALKPISQQDLTELAVESINSICKKGFEYYSLISKNELSDSWKIYISQFSALNDANDFNAKNLAKFFNNLGRKPPFSKKNPLFDESLHEEFADFVKKSKSDLEEEGLSSEHHQKHQDLATKFQALAKSFCEISLRERLDSSILSMADLEGLSLKLIRAAPWTAQKFSKQWDFWMIDEYQDTSPLQVQLLQNLVGDSAHFVVGDPQQSIYLFRGAQSDVFHSKTKDIQESGGEVKTALVNYRSRGPVLEFINSYFQNKPEFSPMEPHKKEGFGEICAEAVIVEKTDDFPDAEKKAILSLIQEKLKAGIPAQEICVLSRANKILEELAAMSFKLGLPVQLHSAGGFSTRREVLDFVSILKFLLNPHDNLNLLSLVRSPWFFIPDTSIVKINADRQRQTSVWSHWCDQVSSIEENTLNKLKFYKDLASQVGISETLSRILTERSMIDLSLHIDPSGRREANLWKILFDLKSKESTPGFNHLQFVDDLQAAADGQDESDATPVIEPDRVNLMTIHASKGLQFSHVIIAGFGNDSRKYYGDWWMIDESTGRWTLSLRSVDQSKVLSLFGIRIMQDRQRRETEEADRVLYVALTRAKDFISFVWPQGPRKGSWASWFPYPIEEGVHQYEKFALRVRTQVPDPQTTVISKMATQECRSPYKVLSAQPLAERFVPTSEGLKYLLQKTQRSSELNELFRAMKYKPDIWDSAPTEYDATVTYLKSLPQIPFKEILEKGHVDWKFKFKNEGVEVSGQLDLWAVLNSEAWIIEYKVGHIKDTKKTFSELEGYAQALYRGSHLKNVKKVHLVVLAPIEKEFQIKTIYF